jgi:hypothetical protein
MRIASVLLKVRNGLEGWWDRQRSEQELPQTPKEWCKSSVQQ